MMSLRKKWQSRILVTAVVCGMIMVAAVSPSSAATPIWGYSFQQLAAEWWQWALSIPWYVNPGSDGTGDNCTMGQRGDVWFLAGTFSPDTVTRTCSVPGDKLLFFPVINTSFFNSPGLCWQDSTSYTVKQMRASVAGFINGASNLSVTLDGKSVRMQREQSVVFDVTLPADNVYGGPPECPGDVYSPTVDDGYYVLLSPLTAGPHTLHIHAEASDFVKDITYYLTVAPVTLK